MNSKLKAISLAALAIAAMSMIGTSAAQAGVGELHVTNTPGKADITSVGTEQEVFTFTNSGATLKCSPKRFEGTIADGGQGPQTTASELTLTATYTGCELTSPVSAAAEVKMNGCKYTITGGVTALTANVDINDCTSGKKIEVIGGGCTITIGAQGPRRHVVFQNEGSGETQSVIVRGTLEGIEYQTEGLFCILGSSTHSDGDYTARWTFSAFADTGQTVLRTHNGHQYNELVCGQQHGLFAT